MRYVEVGRRASRAPGCWPVLVVTGVLMASACAPPGGNGVPSPVSTPAPVPLVVRSPEDAPDVAPGDGSCATTDGGCTLRAALAEANARPGPDRIHFAVPGGGPVALRPATPLPELVDPVVIDGTTQPGSHANAAVAPAPLDGTLQIELLGPGAPGTSALRFGPGSAGSELRGLAIGGFDDAVVLADDRIVVAGNHIGVDASGLVTSPNLGCGVSQGADDSDDARIGGTSPGDRNLISGNGECGISPNTGSDRWVVQGNLIGTDRSGAVALPNRGGGALSLDNSRDHVVGGTSVGAANVISGNETFGIAPQGAHGIRILGNLIGTDATGSRPLPNLVGIGAAADTSVEIGGSGPGAGNVIAGNTWIDVSIGGDRSVVQGNRIGVLIDGTVAVGARWGVALGLSATGNVIGGRGPGEGNEIAGQEVGVLVLGGAGTPADDEIVGNDLHDHGLAGIDLAVDTDGDFRPDRHVGPDPVGAGPDPRGPNGQQPAPLILRAVRSAGGPVVGLVAPASAGGPDLVIDLYGAGAAHPSGHGEGRVLLGSVTVPAGAVVEWSGPWPEGVDADALGVVTATATVAAGLAVDGRGATSEFSAAVALAGS